MAKVATTITLDDKECRDAILAAAKKQINRDVDTGNGGCNLQIKMEDNKLEASLEYKIK